MGADRFTLLAYNPLSGAKVDEVPFTRLTWTEVLSRAGNLTATIPSYIPQATDTALEPGARALHVDDNGLLRASGLIWSHDLDSDQAMEMRVAGEGFFSYYNDGRSGARRPIESRQGMTYGISTGATNGVGVEITFPNASQGTPVDQFDVVADLMAHAYSIAGAANIGFNGIRMYGPGAATASPSFGTTTVSGNKSGVTWARTYWSSDLKGIGSAIAEIAQSSPGFDWAVNVAWDTTTSPPTPRRYLDLYYPRKGQSASGVVLEDGGNVWMLKANRDAAGLANPLRGVGAGTGAAVLTSLKEDTALRYPAGPYPYLAGRFDAHEETIQANLDARTAAHLAAYKAPLNTLTVRVVSDANYGVSLGDVVVGDSCRFTSTVRGSGYMIDGFYRAVSQKVDANTEGIDNWELDLVPDAASTGAA